MKTLGLISILTALLAACSGSDTTAKHESGSIQAAKTQTKYLTGVIWDNTCASAGSHDQMMREKGAKDAKECTLKCADSGSRLVLYNPADRTIYQIDDQDKATQLAGEKVRITGTVDQSTQTIHLENIERLSSQ